MKTIHSRSNRDRLNLKTAQQNDQPNEQCDVLVVGGGPAGSTIATLLAQSGRKVVMLEKAHHPRFHIGESLLPANIGLFERLGVREQVEKIGMPKYGIEFVSPDHDHTSEVNFDEGDNPAMAYSWQVRRSELDEVLFRNAAAHGAKTVEGCRVSDIAFDDDGATVQTQLDDGALRSWRAQFVVDASGRDTFLSARLKLKKRNTAHNSSALFAHFRNAVRLPGRKEGNISILWFAHGWFWFIPLADGTTSVGAVCWPYYLKSRKKPLNEFFMDTIALCPKLAERLATAVLQDDKVHATGNYSYTSSQCAGDKYLMLGDAYTFIDPMFSSGVFLAMQNAFDAVAVVNASLDQPQAAASARKAYEKAVKTGPAEFSWFIFRSTNPTIRDMFMFPKNPLGAKQGLLSLLVGDIRQKTPIWVSLLAFKLFYYLISIGNWKRTVAGIKRRRENIRDFGQLQEENIQKV